MAFTRKLRVADSQMCSGLTAAEKAGDEIVVASENISLNWNSETHPIGKPRASSLYQACMRAHVIGSKENLSQKRWASFGQKLIFGFGNAIHEWAQNSPDLFGERRFGWWRCAACNKVLYFGPPPKSPCPFCKAKVGAIRYHEHFFNMHGDLLVSGHLDLFIKKMAMFRIVELKTMNDKDFLELIVPLVAHSWQIQTYMLGANESNLPVNIDTNLGYVLYISKKWKKGQFPIKMYPVKKDEHLILRIKKKLGTFKLGMADYPGSLPDLIGECKRGELRNYRAKFCAALPFCKKYAKNGG